MSATVGGNTFYVTGARWRSQPRGFERRICEEAVILKVDVAGGRVEKVAGYISPTDVRTDNDPQVLFTGAAFLQDRLYVCTSTEVLTYSLPAFAQIGYLTHPAFNDLHDVAINASGELIIVNTGLDMVMVMSPGGGVIAEYSVCDETLWSRFSRSTDYRKVSSSGTKPRKAHPNHVFCWEGEIWATRCDLHDAVCLAHPGQRIEIPGRYPHDGVVRFGRVYFTSVDGKVSVFDAASRKLEYSADLNASERMDHALGWCRGLAVIEPDLALVGFTRLRPTRWRQKLAWVKDRFGAFETPSAPSRVGLYNLARRELLSEINLEVYDLNEVFGIYQA